MSRARGLAEHQPKQPGRLPARRSTGHKQADAAGNAPPQEPTTATVTALGEPTEGDQTAPAALRSAEGPLASSDSDSEHGSPAQQAALSDLLNGWTIQRYLRALAATGYIDQACDVAGISRRTIEARRSTDAYFRDAEALAKRQFGELMLSKGNQAWINAEDSDRLNHPTWGIFAVKGYLNEFRDTTTVAIDNRQLTVNVLSEQQAEAVGRALAAIPPGEEMV